MKIKKFFKVVAFLLIFCICFFTVQTVLVGDSDTRDQKRISGFFELPEKSLDAVFLGSSATYAFWNAPVAWAEHGISVYPLSNNAQPSFAAKFIIEDTIDKHPDALYIVNISHILVKYDYYVYHLLNNYPFSINKLKMTDYLCNYAEFSLAKKMEYFFPVIRFHNRWSELGAYDFGVTPDEYMGGSRYKEYLDTAKDVSDFEINFSWRADLPEKVVKGMNDLMDYCENKKAKVLFVVMPQAEGKERFSNQNSLVELAESRGFDVLDLRRHIDEIGLDFTKDYYNERHTNIHGSLKVTEFISQYLIENYGFEDKRGDDSYSNWDEAAEKYYKLVSLHLTEKDLKYITVELPEDTEEEK